MISFRHIIPWQLNQKNILLLESVSRSQVFVPLSKKIKDLWFYYRFIGKCKWKVSDVFYVAIRYKIGAKLICLHILDLIYANDYSLYYIAHLIHVSFFHLWRFLFFYSFHSFLVVGKNSPFSSTSFKSWYSNSIWNYDISKLVILLFALLPFSGLMVLVSSTMVTLYYHIFLSLITQSFLYQLNNQPASTHASRTQGQTIIIPIFIIVSHNSMSIFLFFPARYS